MANYVWVSGKKGDWSHAAYWNGDISPGGTLANATISGSGSDVTIASGESYTIESLTLGSGAPSLEVDGYLGFGVAPGVLDLTSGTLEVNGGILANAIIEQAGGKLLLIGATLSGDSYTGTLDVFGDSNLFIENGLTAAGGVIDLSDPTYGSDDLEFLDTETLNSQTIIVGESDGSGGPYIQDLYGTLTLGAGVVITQAASTPSYGGADIQGNIVNEGRFNISGGEFDIRGNYDYATNAFDDNFVNAETGTIAIGNGADVITDNIPTFTNQGLISVAGGGLLDLYAQTFANTGVISVASGGTLDLSGYFALGALGAVSLAPGATLEVDGTLDLGGGTITVAPAGEFANLLVSSGTLANGEINQDGGTLSLSYATLSNIAYTGTLDVFGNSYLYVENGLTAAGGVIDLSDPNYGADYLSFQDSETLSDQTIIIGEDDSYDGGFIQDLYGTLTLGADDVITQAATTTDGGDIEGNIVNEGRFDIAGGEFIIQRATDYATDSYDDNFVNAATGTIAIGNGAEVYVDNFPTFTNQGLISVANGGLLDFDAQTFSNTGTILVASGGTLELDAYFAPGELGRISVASGGTVELFGTLDLGGGTITIAPAGEFANLYVSSGTLANGEIKQAGGTLSLDYATLDDITYTGTLDVFGDTPLYVENGLTATGGVIDLSDPNYGADYLSFQDSETLNNQTIIVGESDGYSGGYIEDQDGTLTLGPSVLITQAATTTNGALIEGNIVNEGEINIAGGAFYVEGEYDNTTGAYDDNFVNAATGTIAVGDGGDLYVGGVPTFTNLGLITVDSGGRLDLNTGTLLNTGKISIGNGGILALQGSFALTELGPITIAAGGTFEVAGTLNLGGGTIDVTPTGEFANLLVYYGTLENGELKPGDGGTVSLQSATLDDISYTGTLDVFGSNDFLYIENGLTATGGVIDLSDPNGGYDNLYFQDSETLNNQTIVVGEDDGYGNGGIDGSGTLTLGPNALITQASTTTNGASINDNFVSEGQISIAGGIFYFFNDDFVNAVLGTIAVSSGAAFDVYNASTFTNQGLIEGIGAGTASVNINATKFTNYANTTLTNGTYEAAASNTLALNFNAPLLSTNDATIILNGPGSEIQIYNTATATYTSLESKLTKLGAGGTLAILGGRGYTTTGTITIAGGTINLAGGTFKAAGLTLSTLTSEFLGYGTINNSISNFGLIEATTNTLDITSPLTGTGSLLINKSSKLELAAATTESVTFTGTAATASTLKLDSPTSYTGTLTNLAAGDIINIAPAIVTTQNLSGTTLTITLASGATLAIPTTGVPTGERFGIKSDGATGSNLTLFREAAATAAAPNPVTFGEVHTGALATTTLSIANSQPSDGFSESLDGGFSGTSFTEGGFSANGSFTTLAANTANSTALQITLATGTGGAVNGTATISLASDGLGTDSDSAVALSSQTVSVTGAVYNYATASPAPPNPIAFGIVHVGQSVSQYLTVSNTAQPGAYSENLDAYVLNNTGALTTSGTLQELAAGSQNSTALQLLIATNTAGAITGGATLALISDGSTIDTLGTTILGYETVAVTGTVNNYATAAIETISGPASFSSSGATYNLNFGYLSQNSEAAGETLGILNSATGPADLLSGSFAIASSTGFANTGFTTFSAINTGAANTAPTIAVNSSAVGTFTETIIISPTGSNASGYTGALTDITLIATAIVEGAASIAAGGTLELASGNNGYQQISFTSIGGELVIDGTVMPSATIYGFAPGDSIKLSGVAYNAAQDSVSVGTAGVVTIDAAGAIYELNIAGAVLGETNFSLSGDLLLTESMACFAAGTRIRTVWGDVAVEDIVVGDKLVTVRDGAMRLVVWVGQRTIDFASHAAPDRVVPVRVTAGAMGGGLPARDLVLSPDHALFVDDHLIEVKTLVNGATIYREEGVRSVTYYHIELERHDVILAEGLAVESYLDTGNRGMFEGQADVLVLAPDFGAPCRDSGCAPLLSDGPAVWRVRERLLGVAALAGFAITDDVDFVVSAGGEVITPQIMPDGEMLFVLPFGAVAADVISAVGVPAESAADPSDRRRLGVSVGGMALIADGRCSVIPLDDAGHSGFHVMEDGHRWTDGAARIELPSYRGKAVLELRINGQAARWRRPTSHPAALRLATALIS